MKYRLDDITNTVVNADCLDVLRELPDGCIDLVATDPPYGIEASKGVGGFGSSGHTAKHYEDDWDSQTPPIEVFNEMLRVAKQVIIFGGNFFTDKLPVNGHWIVWDKTGGIKFDNPFGDCELAWTNIARKSVKKYIVIQQGFVSEEKQRYHPTQKPVSLMTGIINDYTEPNDLILDCYSGSGSTLVAAQKLQRRFIGVELSPEYCTIARQRLAQKPLF